MTAGLSIDDIIAALESIPNRDIKLTPYQREVIEHEEGPVWIMCACAKQCFLHVTNFWKNLNETIPYTIILIRVKNDSVNLSG